MKMRKWVLGLIAVSAGIAASAQDLNSGLVCRYDFDRNPKVILHQKARIENGALQLNGKGDFATIPDSSNWHLTPDGMTLALTLRMNDVGVQGDHPDALDMFCAKPNEFLFARNRDTLYFNLHNGKKWIATFKAVKVPLNKDWNHYAVTIEHYNDRAQGEAGYQVNMYLNGELEATQRFPDLVPGGNQNPFDLGKGFGGPWFFNGEIANFTLYKRALTGGDVARLAAAESRVRIKRKGLGEIPAEIKAASADFIHSPLAVKWVVNAFLRSAAQGADSAIIAEGLRILSRYKNEKDLKTLAGNFNAAQKRFRIVISGKSAVMLQLGAGKGSHPVMGFYDCRRKIEIFGERTISWEITYRKGKQTGQFGSWDESVSWQADLQGNRVLIHWEGKKPFAFAADSEVNLLDGRLESNFAVKNHSPGHILSGVSYPVYALNRLPGKTDHMVFPFMSGILIPNPTVNRFKYGQEGLYPSGRIAMQFGAYYDEDGGIYFGFEDGLGRTKIYEVNGKRGNLHVSWQSPVALKIGASGGNDFSIHGKAALQLFRGNWYHAGQIYRDFLEKSAVWWIRELPRKSTPEWIRNMTLGILFTSSDRKSAEDFLAFAGYLRSYLELPFTVSWYGWDDCRGHYPHSEKALGWPHFYPKDYALEINKKFQQAGLYTLPYIDSRLWEVRDGINQTDYQYSSHGAKFAVRMLDGKAMSETYDKTRKKVRIYSIMCPGAEGWRNVLVNLAVRMANYGFSGLYHDQVGTGKPGMCFDPEHGHALNDAAVWLEQGYWLIFDRIFKKLRTTHPEFCHTTEENAEPYLKQFDAYLVWRWTDQEQIPLYQSIYSGRAQFYGRTLNTSRGQGDEQSFFSKQAQQLVNAEQLGGFKIGELTKMDNRRLFIKKAAHMRKALLYWFNEGRMLEPISFKKMPMGKTLWGGNSSAQMLTLPKIASSAWLGQDGSKMYLFVNTYPETIKAEADIPVGKDGIWICKEGASEPVRSDRGVPLEISAFGFEVWLEGSREKASEIQAVLKRIHSFDMGSPLTSVIKFGKKIQGVPGKMYTARDVADNLACSIAEDYSFIGWISSGAMISFGEVDFGPQGTSELILNLAVPLNSKGSVDVYAFDPGKTDRIAATLPLKTTGGWRIFKDFPVQLKQPLKGKKYLMFRINNDSSCNFKGWRYTPQQP